ncbi:hypothetical protein KY290_033602 [Solanum tuberosum]|uniref:Uncharacterized protein n=1 Tax=Solanum tuberosum TaxID=4113 RepID=A0ABQ7U0T1_SOLTU|nr:hypothetical protein KY289_034728 [Solanum tuberosum]KAH0647614.1 hypothetical protein KY285_032862 [Solanum tuberosum]KAH0740559.1 hypothetical protein KY290_033602 [Solanum tuberosum]
MARMLITRRRRCFYHKQTICSNEKTLNSLLLHRNNMIWEEFASQIQTSQVEVNPGRGKFHENPTACICADSELDTGAATISARRDMGEVR